MNDRARKAVLAVMVVITGTSLYLMPARTVPTFLIALTLIILLSVFFVAIFIILWKCLFPSRECKRMRAMQEAESAARAGHLAYALRIYHRHQLYSEAITCLADHLPAWNESRQLIVCVDQLFRLQKSIVIATHTGSALALTVQLEQEVERAIRTILESAERFAAAGRQLDHYEPLREILRPKGERLERLSRTCRDARTTLAKRTLCGTDETDLEEAELRVTALEEAIRDLVDDDLYVTYP